MKNVNSRVALRTIPVALLAAAAAFGGASTALAAPAQIPASATVMAPITVSEPASIRFGSVAAGAADGTVLLAIPTTLSATQPTTAAPINNSTRTATGGAVLVGGGTCSATVLCGVGSVQVVGATGASMSTVSLPTSITLTLSGGTATMAVDTFTKRYGAPGTAGVLTGATAFGTGGKATVVIGGTLKVLANQAEGSYSGQMDINVDY